jgi:hypothetical protein
VKEDAVTNSPTFVATFADGEVTRMTTWHAPAGKTFDLTRGVKLARHAYRSRTGKEPPVISTAHFEDANGVVLERYDTKQIAEESS